MKSKKPSLYDAQEEQIQLQSASFVDFLTRKGVLEDHNIDNERVRKAKKDTAQRAYLLHPEYRSGQCVWPERGSSRRRSHAGIVLL